MSCEIKLFAKISDLEQVQREFGLSQGKQNDRQGYIVSE